jgi:hypothetical protein
VNTFWVALGISASLASPCLAQTPICAAAKTRPATDMSDALDRLVKIVGFQPGTILLYESDDAQLRQFSDAAAVQCFVGHSTE